MRPFLKAVLAIVWKDLLLELRTKEVVVPVAVFAVLILIIFNFALDLRPTQVAPLAPGVLWAAFTFAGVLGLNRSFSLEKERGGIEGLMLAPVGREAIYLGKMLASFLFLMAVEVIMFPVFSLLFGLNLFMPELWLIGIVATLGYTAVGTVFSAMAVNTRAREIMLPVLFFPIAAPVIIAAVEFSGGAYRGADFASILKWLHLTLVFDIIFVAIATWTFEFLLQE